MIHSTFKFNIYHTEFFGQCWQPEKVESVIVLIHGMGEHSSRYEDSVVPALVENGHAIIAYDNFGHGRTKGKRGHCPSYEALLDSIDQAIDIAGSKFPGVPKFLYGHSMGGNLVLNYILRRTPEIKGLITSSPFLRLAFKPPKWKITLGELMLKIWPSLTLPSELEEKAISRVDAEVKRYKKDPLIHDKISPMFTFPVMEAGEWAITNGNTVRIPVLVLHGTGDRIIDHKASMEFANTSKMVEIKMFENGYHELHHDLCHEEFMKTIINWLENQKKSSS